MPHHAADDSWAGQPQLSLVFGAKGGCERP